MSTVITVENLGKKYTISHQQREEYSSLREVITNGAKSLGKKLFNPFHRTLIPHPLGPSIGSSPLIAPLEDFWALHDVSFEVKQGDRIGIIGRNGAGKSTLLKILSRITEPTNGRIRIKGRVASLLEVGTGFHPELTGRENIYLNGAILGMHRDEIRRKFDEIVDFAEIEKFLDTPVKRYSSGMYVRLAFAVAAHLEPEILIVDEVLAVGDAQFQKKCLGKLQEVGNEGRTVLFVSHNMQAIKQLCSRAILLRSGVMLLDDEPSKVIDVCFQDGVQIADEETLEKIIQNLPPDPVFKLEGITLTQDGLPTLNLVENGKPIEVEICYQVFKKTTGLRVFFDLCDDQNTLLFRSFHDEDGVGMPVTEPGYYVSNGIILANLLGPIKYELRIHSGIFNVRGCLPESGICIPLKVKQTGHYNRAYMTDIFRGKFALEIKWKTERLH